MLLHAWSRDLLSCRRLALRGVRQVACGAQCLVGGVWHVVGGGWQVSKILTSVSIIVWTLSLARPPRRDLTMPHGHGVDNCSLRFCKKGRQLDLGESRSPIQIFQWNLLLPSHRLWVYVRAFGANDNDGDGDGGDVDDGDDDGVGDGDYCTRST